MHSKPVPKDWPRITPAIYYQNPNAAITWLCDIFGFEIRLKIDGENGRVEHSELTFGDGLIMVGTAASGPTSGPKEWQSVCASPQQVGSRNTQAVAVFVDDADAHCARARAGGAHIFREPQTQDYGAEYWSDRSYGAVDLEGHQWWFMQRMR